jgi:hypothetical protein
MGQLYFSIYFTNGFPVAQGKAGRYLKFGLAPFYIPGDPTGDSLAYL